MASSQPKDQEKVPWLLIRDDGSEEDVKLYSV